MQRHPTESCPRITPIVAPDRQDRPVRVDIRLLGRFVVAVDGQLIPAGAWRRRSMTALVKLLALQPERPRREQVIHALWPDLLLDEAAPRCTRPLPTRARRWAAAMRSSSTTEP